MKRDPETILSTTNVVSLKQEIAASVSIHGTGGMASKIDAAEIAQKAGIETWIVNGLNDNFIIEGIKKTIEFTKITVA